MKTLNTIKTNNEFDNIINELITNDTVLKMKNYRQHFSTSCFDHCYCVASYCYCICKKFNLDYKSATRAGMLHDLFLYDWRERTTVHRFHAFYHGKVACKNACELFELNKKEKDMIIRHMWPVTFAIPNSIEGFILTLVDKYCAISEFWKAFKFFTYSKKFFRYSYLFLGVIIFNMKQI